MASDPNLFSADETHPVEFGGQDLERTDELFMTDQLRYCPTYPPV